MVDYTIYILTVMAVLMVISWKIMTKRKGKTMPGPPILEGLMNFGKGSFDMTLHLYLTEWSKRYGDIFQVNLLFKNIVVVSEAQTFRHLVKDAELRDFTNDRPPLFYRDYVNKGDIEIILASYGPVLQQRRRLFHNILKFYGEGRGNFENLMITTLEDLVETFRGKDSIEISVEIRKYILFLVSFLLTGDITDAGKKKLSKLQDFSTTSDEIFAFHNEAILSTFPFLRFVPGLHYKRVFNQVVSAKDRMNEAFFHYLKSTYDPSHKRGMIDEMLSIAEQSGTEKTQIELNDQTIMGMTQDTVGAGYLTSSAALSAMFLNLIKHPDIQARMYEEIKTVLGESTPGFRHKQKMPYTEAVILETMRISSVVPLLLPHMIRKDITFDGYHIPKNTVLIMNAWHNHHRADHWQDPYKFKPERFLDDNGQVLESDHPQRQKLIPFGSGRRSCPGETFARSRVFLISIFLLQHYEFLPPEDESSLPSLNPDTWKCGSVVSPQNFHCRIKPRPH